MFDFLIKSYVFSPGIIFKFDLKLKIKYLQIHWWSIWSNLIAKFLFLEIQKKKFIYLRIRSKKRSIFHPSLPIIWESTLTSTHQCHHQIQEIKHSLYRNSIFILRDPLRAPQYPSHFFFLGFTNHRRTSAILISLVLNQAPRYQVDRKK